MVNRHQLLCITVTLCLLFGASSYSFGQTFGVDSERGTEKVETPIATTFQGYEIRNLSDINTVSLEYAPSVTADGALLYFVSNRDGGEGGHDLWFSEVANLSTLEYYAPRGVTGVNSDRNEGTAAISADGSLLVYSACNRPGGVGDCDIYWAERVESGWADRGPVPMVNSIAWDSQPTISAGADTLLFVSNRDADVGVVESDIYRSVRNSAGEWGAVERLGSDINTAMREDSPFLVPGTNILLFSSAGRSGFGGLDFYRAELMGDGTYGNVANLGEPINTSADERFISASPDLRMIYFTSARQEPTNFGSLDIFVAITGDATVPVAGSGTQLRITPNPATRSISLLQEGLNRESASIKVYDARGELVLDSPGINGSGEIDVSELPNGFYYIRSSAGDGTFVIRR